MTNKTFLCPSHLPPPPPVTLLPHAPPPGWLPPPPPVVTKTTTATGPVLKDINKVEKKLYISKPKIIESTEVRPRSTIIAKIVEEKRSARKQNPTPQNSLALVSAILEFELGVREVLVILDELKQNGCTDPLIRYYRGIAYQQVKNFTLASEEFEASVRSDPSNVGAWEHLIQIYTKEDDFSDVLDKLSNSNGDDECFVGIASAFLCFYAENFTAGFLTKILEEIRDKGHSSYKFIARYCLAYLIHEHAPFFSHKDYISLMEEAEKGEKPYQVHKDSLVSRILLTLIDDCEKLLPEDVLTDDRAEKELIRDYILYHDSYLERHPENIEIRSSKCAILIKSKRYKELLECAKAGVLLNIRDSHAWYNLALAHFYLHKYNEATKCAIECYKYVSFQESSEDEAECFYLFGRIFEELRMYPEALWSHTEANKKKITSSYCVAQARSLYKLNDGKKSLELGISLLESELGHDPFNFEVLRVLCKFYIRGHHKECLETLLKMVENFENTKEAQEFRQTVHYYLSRYQKAHNSPKLAIEGFKSLLAENPRHIRSLRKLIQHYDGNNYELGKATVEELASLAPTCVKSRMVCSNFFNNHHEGNLAIHHIEAVEKINDVRFTHQVLFQKSRALFFMGRYQESVDLAQATLRIENISDSIRMIMYETLGGCYYYQDKYDLSLIFFNKFLDLNKNSDDPSGNDKILHNRSLIYRAQKKWAEAIRDLETIRKRDPNNPEALRGLIECYYRINPPPPGKLEGLINEYHKKFPWKWSYVEYVIKSLCEKNFYSNAIMKLEEILKQKPEDVSDIPKAEAKLSFLKKKVESAEMADKISKEAEVKAKAAADEKRRTDVRNWRENYYKKPAKPKKKKSVKSVEAPKSSALILTVPQKKGISSLLSVLNQIKNNQVDVGTWTIELMKFYGGQDIEFDENTVDLLEKSTELEFLKKNIDTVYKALEKLTI